MPEHVVVRGDCISSIAEEYGFDWRVVWDHPGNAALKRLRKDPNILAPGDIVVVPEKTVRNHPAATDRRHQFVRKGTPAKLRLQLLDVDHKVRANVRYVAEVAGALIDGVTDSEGRIEAWISPMAQSVSLKVQGQDEEEVYELSLGHLDPITEINGVRQRLINLGFSCDDEGDQIGESTRAAVRAFQLKFDLPETGELDQATRDRLLEKHGA